MSFGVFVLLFPFMLIFRDVGSALPVLPRLCKVYVKNKKVLQGRDGYTSRGHCRCHEQALGATYIVPARCQAKLDIASFWRSWFSGWSVPNIMSSFQQSRVRLPFWQIFVSDLLWAVT